MKRQRGRNRSGGGGGGGGGGKPNHNVNRAFDSNGPDNVKIRGHAQHVYEKYQQLARDASASGDRVLAENYLQHAEHYFRVLRSIQPHRPASEIMGRDALASGFDIDFEDESGGAAAEAADEAEAGAEAGEGEERAERPERPERQDQREGQFRDRREGRRDRFEGRRDDRGFREGGRYGEGRRDEQRSEEDREAEPARDPMAVIEPEAAPLPRAEAAASPMLRSQDGGISQAPAFLQAPPVAPGAEDGEPRRPRTRTRRRPRTFEGAAEGEGSTGESSDEG